MEEKAVQFVVHHGMFTGSDRARAPVGGRRWVEAEGLPRLSLVLAIDATFGRETAQGACRDDDTSSDKAREEIETRGQCGKQVG